MRLRPIIVLVFTITPLAEIALFVVVGRRIGVVATLAIVFATAAIGASLVSRQGRVELAGARATIMAGSFPATELANGAMILVAGVLLITPGFVTDATGFLLLVPAVRKRIRVWASRRFGSGALDVR
jgi:UPF0716 protein FxsA